MTLFPVLFLLMFTYLFGGAMVGSTEEYLQWVLPGILVMTVVMITLYTGVTLNTDITKGVFDRFRSLPRPYLPSRVPSSARCWAMPCATRSCPRVLRRSRRR